MTAHVINRIKQKIIAGVYCFTGSFSRQVVRHHAGISNVGGITNGRRVA